MKSTTTLKMTTSVVALIAAAAAPAQAQQAGWTGGSSYYYSCTGGTCAATGDNHWGNAANWSGGVAPTATTDVNIGLSTYQSGTSPRPTQHDTVDIVSGSTADARSVTIGFTGARSDSGSFGRGELNVTENSHLNVGRTLTVGADGRGDLNIEAGSSVDAQGRVTVGADEPSQGVLRNAGTMVNRQDLIVGVDGEGIAVTEGAGAITETRGDTRVGGEETGLGVVVVRDGGTMTGAGRFDVGYEDGSTGIVVINNGGTARVGDGNGTLTLADEAGSTGILNIGAYSPTGGNYGIDSTLYGVQPGDLSAAAGFGNLDAKTIQFGQGAGFVNFKHTGTAADDSRFKAGFAGDGTVTHYAGYTVLDGDSSGFTGTMTVLGGVAVANNVLAGKVAVAADGTLGIGDGGTTGDVVNDIYSEGLTQFNRSDRYVYDSVISGTGAVEQVGTGTTVLTGANSYTGKTTVTNGTLQLGDGGTSGSIANTSGVEIEENGTLAFNRSDAVLFDRKITGTGKLAQIGSGLTNITEDNSGFTGGARVEKGILSVNGVLKGTMDVQGGMLEGVGRVGATTVRKDGAIAPGNILGERIARLTVDGDLTHEAGSKYLADLRSTGQNDLLQVTGKADIAEGSVLDVSKLDKGRYELEHRYTVLSAAGGVTGDYNLTGDTWVSTFYQVEDHYDANNVYLDVAQHRLFQEAGKTRNQIAAATAAQELKAERDPKTNYPTNELFRAIAYLQTDGEAQHAFDVISGEIHASAKADLVESSKFVRDAVTSRIRGAFGLDAAPSQSVVSKDGRAATTPGDAEGTVLWANGFGSWGTLEGDGNAGDLDRNIGGAFVGIDTPVAQNFRIGLVGGYSDASYDAAGRQSTGSSRNFDLGVYGGGQWDAVGVRLGANYTWHKLEFDRSVVFPGFAESISSDYDGHTIQAYGDIGYTIRQGAANFEPFAALAYVSTKTDGYAETGGVSALTGESDDMGTGFSTLGLRASTEFQPGVTVRGMAGWRHAFGDTDTNASHAFAGSSVFTVGGVPISKNLAVLELGVDAAVNEKLTVGVSYAGQLGDGVQDHGLKGKLDWKF
jgi:outer membrane autotransporter protein